MPTFGYQPAAPETFAILYPGYVNAVPVYPAATSVNSATSTTVLLAADATRTYASIKNSSTAHLWIDYGIAAVVGAGTATDIAPGATYVVGNVVVAGAINGIWVSVNGTAAIQTATS